MGCPFFDARRRSCATCSWIFPGRWSGAVEGPGTWSPFDVVGHLIQLHEPEAPMLSGGLKGRGNMKAKNVYLVSCIAGTLLPYSQFVPFLREHGLDLRVFVEQLFSNRIGGFFGLDVIVSSVVLWAFVAIEGRRAGMKHLWAPVAANLAVGVSLGLPLFLYLREQRLGGNARRTP
jgi:hypothetical protein